MIPRATYRLQLHRGFTFQDAIALIPYLARLGISHVYCSPYFRARPGSTHGYDVIDHSSFNPEIGTTEDFREFVATLRAHGMGHIADVVPNHVGIDKNNRWWWDVLENGAASVYAQYFDIEWDIGGKVLVPMLGDLYGNVLDSGELRLAAASDAGRFEVLYHEHSFPIAARDSETARSMLCADYDAEALHALLERQPYRLAYWRVASEEVNYRRFFDINDLAAVRVENLTVFEATHGFLLSLIRAGDIDGIRIDHPDGLYDPQQYFTRLRDLAKPADESPLYLVVEKITAGFERLPAMWPVDGTTGYQFANLVNGLFVDQRAKGRMQRVYRNFIGQDFVWADIVYESKAMLLKSGLAAEFAVLSRQLLKIARADRHTRDFTQHSLDDALFEIIACFPVYRTYVTDRVSADDRRFFDWAVNVAKRRGSPISALVYEFIRAVLLGEMPGDRGEGHEMARCFVRKFQQVTAPVCAKGVEDTAMYRFHRLVSLNEVGGDPDTFGVSPTGLHRALRSLQRDWPQGMLTTSTHDTKRSEDVRARIDLLSEMPAAWRIALQRWRRINESHKRMVDGEYAPSANQEYLLYQILVGTWPTAGMSQEEGVGYRQRIDDYMIKVAREAKTRTSWSDIRVPYENALQHFIGAILDPRPENTFLRELGAMQALIGRLGCINGLAQTLCKLTAPGVPDIYQGTELWDYSLVDPDNRRPVDFDRRRRLLESINPDAAASPELAGELLQHIEDGRAKLHVIARTLRWRAQHEALFRTGEYLALRVRGDKARHLFAYLRRRRGGGETALIAFPRLCVGLLKGRESFPLGERTWGNTVIELPQSLRPAVWANILEGSLLDASSFEAGLIPVRILLQHFPVALASTL